MGLIRSQVGAITRMGGRVADLAGKASWAAFDQALFAGSNFILNLLLVRWLEPGEYGAFSLVYAVFLLAGTAHSALLTEPMLVFGPGRHASGIFSYLGTVVRLHWYGA